MSEAKTVPTNNAIGWSVLGATGISLLVPPGLHASGIGLSALGNMLFITFFAAAVCGIAAVILPKERDNIRGNFVTASWVFGALLLIGQWSNIV